jgi:DNA-binding MarR family transcriptional regulator
MQHNTAFGFERPEDSPGFLLWQTTTIWQRLIKKMLESHDISHAQFVITAVLLWFEEHGETATQVAIARFSKLDKMTVSKSLKKLTEQGYVNRSESETDTRAKNVSLTDAGKIKVSELIPLVEGIDERFFKVLGSIGVHQLNRLLNGLVQSDNLADDD